MQQRDEQRYTFRHRKHHNKNVGAALAIEEYSKNNLDFFWDWITIKEGLFIQNTGVCNAKVLHVWWIHLLCVEIICLLIWLFLRSWKSGWEVGEWNGQIIKGE